MKNKILITSIPCWNQRSGSDTLSSLFKSFDRNDLANIYISPDIPDSEVCSRYFNIREWQVVRSVFKRNTITGEEVKAVGEAVSDAIVAEQNLTKHFAVKRRRIFLWLRELAWRLGNWNSEKLDAFLEDFNPDVLVFPIESYPYFNLLNEYIIRKCKPAKVVGYLWDDNFTYKQHPKSLLFKLERYFLRKQVRRLVNSCTDILAISPKMKKECDAEFGVDSVILTKPIVNHEPFKKYTLNTPLDVLYTGKLNIGRDTALSALIDALERSPYGPDQIQINVYTGTVLSKTMKEKLEGSSFCKIHPPVPQKEVFSLQKNADVLLFLESLSQDDLTARLSFSTKLTDYFSAGKCVWAIGNADLGPISYIYDENAGVVSRSVEEMESAIVKLLEDKSTILEYAERAYECGKTQHNYDKIINRLKSIIE